MTFDDLLKRSCVSPRRKLVRHLRSQRSQVTMKTKRYDHYLPTVLRVGSEDRNFYQPMATGLESVRGVVSQPSTTGPGPSNPLGGKDNEPLASTHQVRPLIATHITHVHGFRQLSTQVIVKDIQDAEQNISNIEPISGTAESTVIAIGSANTAMVQIDSISSTYLQPLSIFNAVVTGIANVRLANQNGPILMCNHAQIHPYAQMALSALTMASQVYIHHTRYRRLIRSSTAHSVSSKFGCLHRRPSYPNQTNFRAHLGQRVPVED